MMDSGNPKITAANIQAMWKGLKSSGRPQHLNRFGMPINTPPELILRRIDDEFEDAISMSATAILAEVSRRKLSAKRYRVVVVMVIGRNKAVFIGPPKTFHESQSEVDSRHGFFAEREALGERPALRWRVFMLEVHP